MLQEQNKRLHHICFITYFVRLSIHDLCLLDCFKFIIFDIHKVSYTVYIYLLFGLKCFPSFPLFSLPIFVYICFATVDHIRPFVVEYQIINGFHQWRPIFIINYMRRVEMIVCKLLYYLYGHINIIYLEEIDACYCYLYSCSCNEDKDVNIPK